jgi:hypothetical protein
MSVSTAGQSVQPTASAKRRGLPGPGFAAPNAANSGPLDFSSAQVAVIDVHRQRSCAIVANRCGSLIPGP